MITREGIVFVITWAIALAFSALVWGVLIFLILKAI